MSCEEYRICKNPEPCDPKYWGDVEWMSAIEDYEHYQNLDEQEFPNQEWEEYCHMCGCYSYPPAQSKA